MSFFIGQKSVKSQKNMDLSLVDVKDLADEIMRRADTGVIIFKTLEQKQVYVNWVGDYYGALGMCAEMQSKITNEEEDGS